MPKITRATFKSFLNKNKENLFIKNKSSFDGMVDCVMPIKGDFKKLTPKDFDISQENTLGYREIWLVGHGDDYFTAYEDDIYKGYEVYNCCGSFILAIKK